MAGIGFVLRKLSRQDNLIGTIEAYVISSLVSSGPWLFTILALGSITAISTRFVSFNVLSDFRLVIIYNFSFSLVSSAPVCLIVTRYLADKIFLEDVSNTPGMLVGALTLIFVIEVPIAFFLYFVLTDFPLGFAISALINYVFISAIWLISVFHTALKNHRAITVAFGVGMGLTVIGAVVLSEEYGAPGILNAFNIGFTAILGLLISRVLSEYPYPFQKPFAFLSYFKKYGELALSGLVYNIAIWSDKWIMWFSNYATTGVGGLPSYSDYDSAMFLAYLTVIPSLAMFVMHVETDFYEKHVRFYRDIQNGATLRQIMTNWHQLITSVFHSARSLLVLQGSVCVIVILTSVKLFQLLNINFTQLGIFRFGVLGTMFQAFSMYLLILLSYFDNRKATLLVQFVFLVSNTLFTAICLRLGFKFFGYGYFLSTLVTFIAAAAITIKYLDRLPYHTFVTRNLSIDS